MKKRKKKAGQTNLPRARRLARAPAWLAAYDGLPENIARNYRKKFHVDILTAIRDLQELGYEFRPGYAEAVEAGEKRRMEQKAAEKLERQEQERMERYPDSDDRFFYIAGYISGGAPYGVTWEQMGMEPYGDLWEALPEEYMEPDEEDEPDDEIFFTPVPLECVPNTLQQEMTNVIRAELCEFIDEHGCVPDDKNALYIRESAAFSFDEALSAVLRKPSMPDPGTLVPLYERALEITLAEYARDGIEVKDASWLLTMLETPRLILRKLTRKDEPRLQAILGNPEVMYAWEDGFSPEDTRHWMNQQIASYSKYRCGYWAAVLRDSGEMIGFIGVLRSKIRKQTAYEIGYILDKPYWRQGYALEGARACLGYAFDTLKRKEVFCTIRPENHSSIRVAERLGMQSAGEYVKLYNGKEMPHYIYAITKAAYTAISSKN